MADRLLTALGHSKLFGATHPFGWIGESIFNFGRAFRALLHSILHVFKSVVWTLVIVRFIIYIFGLLFMQAVVDHFKVSGGKERKCNDHVFYLALPSFLFAQAIEALKSGCWSDSGFVRVIVEKPSGKNGADAKALSDSLWQHLDESQTFRIDHYLAKTLVTNLLTLKFANREFGYHFRAHHIADARITF